MAIVADSSTGLETVKSTEGFSNEPQVATETSGSSESVPDIPESCPGCTVEQLIHKIHVWMKKSQRDGDLPGLTAKGIQDVRRAMVDISAEFRKASLQKKSELSSAGKDLQIILYKICKLVLPKEELELVKNLPKDLHPPKSQDSMSPEDIFSHAMLPFWEHTENLIVNLSNSGSVFDFFMHACKVRRSTLAITSKDKNAKIYVENEIKKKLPANPSLADDLELEELLVLSLAPSTPLSRPFEDELVSEHRTEDLIGALALIMERYKQIGSTDGMTLKSLDKRTHVMLKVLADIRETQAAPQSRVCAVEMKLRTSWLDFLFLLILGLSTGMCGGSGEIADTNPSTLPISLGPERQNAMTYMIIIQLLHASAAPMFIEMTEGFLKMRIMPLSAVHPQTTDQREEELIKALLPLVGSFNEAAIRKAWFVYRCVVADPFYLDKHKRLEKDIEEAVKGFLKRYRELVHANPAISDIRATAEFIAATRPFPVMMMEKQSPEDTEARVKAALPFIGHENEDEYRREWAKCTTLMDKLDWKPDGY